MRKIYLIRHTTPEVSQGLMYGQTDLDVAVTFKEELRQIQPLIANREKLPLYSSPLIRCRKLAEALEQKPLKFDERIKEMNFGDWEMKHWDALDPQLRKDWIKNIDKIAPPNGESNAQLRQRSIEFWEELQTKQYPQVGVVTHFGVIQSVLSHLLHIPVEKAYRLDIGYGAVIQVTIREEQFFKIKFLR